MVALIQVVVALVVRFLGASVVRFVATKILMMTVTTLVLPVILYNVFTKIQTEMMQYRMDQMGTIDGNSVIVNLTGMAAWIADQIQLPEAMAIFLGAIATRYAMSWLENIKLGA